MKECQNNIRKIDARLPDPNIIKAAADVLKKGGIVAFPTTGLYGLAADAFNPDAVRGLFRLKKRPPNNPILILIKNRAVIDEVAEIVPPEAMQFMDRFWPGDITIVLKARADLPETLTGGTGKIGVRIPAHPVAQALVKAFDNPVTGTSANISGEPGCAEIKNMDDRLLKKLDLILDAGPLKGDQGSTVIDVSERPFRLIREGRIGKEEIFSLLDSGVLF